MNPDHCSSVMGIEKLPTAVLAHILSFLPEKEAVRTCLLSRRWKEVWKFNDKISRLPTDVLVRILSYLPAIEAVRTCVLSKHWKQAQAWKLIKNFFFDDSGVGFRLHVFEKVLAGVLTQMEEARGIQKISICCSEMPDGDVLKWLLDFAFEHHIRELELRIGGGGQFELPYEIISSTHLEVLTLHLNLRNPSLNGIYFTALKKLDVGLYRPESSLTETFFNNLPVLEDLSIRAVVDGISVTKFYITSHILKSLTITLTREGAGKNDHTVHIRAKNLERLYVKDSTLVNYFIHEAHFLKEASLDFSYTGDQHVQKPWVLRFFLSITTVRWLNLSEDGLSVLSFVDNLLPTFSDLTHLNVSIKEAGLPMLATILHRSPRLKVMTILLKFSDRDQVLWMEPTKVPYCLKANLKKIKIQGCTGGTAEVKIIEYILKKAEVLEMMVIKFNFEGGEIPAMISEFERASHTCDIEIFEDGHQR